MEHPLHQYKIGNIPTAYYVPNYITEQEEANLLKHIYDNSTKWKGLSGRRVQNWGGIPHPKGMVAVPLPDWLLKIGTRMATESGVFDGEIPNHVLVNEYLPGGGIMPHEDGPLYKPHFGILSLQSTLVMDIYAHKQKTQTEDTNTEEESTSEPRKAVFSIVLQPRSLLVFKDELYTSYLHGIEFRTTDTVDDSIINLELAGIQHGTIERAPRVSLTIRAVNKVLKNVIQLQKKK